MKRLARLAIVFSVLLVLSLSGCGGPPPSPERQFTPEEKSKAEEAMKKTVDKAKKGK